MRATPADTWVFGYGSLMWNPGFPYAEARRAQLVGYHRAFCIYSIHYRGTERRPGLVLGLDRGGVCEGMAFRLAPETRAAALTYLRRRELIYSVYREALLPIRLAHDEGEEQPTVRAVAYISERAHPAYAGRLSLTKEARMIRAAAGKGGTNLDYLLSTRRHLVELGIHEPRIERLLAMTGPLAARGTAAAKSSCASLAKSWASRPSPRPRTVRDNRFAHRAKLACL